MTPDGKSFQSVARRLRNLYRVAGWCYQGFKATPARGLVASPTQSRMMMSTL